jgi:hypothetical protein
MAARQGVEYWREQVEGWRASGLSQIAYCEQHGLNIKSFRRWRTKLQRTAATALTLVPISVGAPIGAPAIRLHSPGGWRIELANANPTWLADLVRQLP